MYAHRYRAGTGFVNPSVYCADLLEMITQLTVNPPAVTVTRNRSANRPGKTRPVHGLPAGALDALAAGPGDVAAVMSLAQLRLSSTRALVSAVAASVPPRALGRRRNAELATAAAEGWAVLCDLDAAHPGAVVEVLCHPYTYAWAIRCLDPPADANPELDRAHLAGLAAAAAVRAGVSAELPLPMRDCLTHVPSLGALTVAPDAGRTVRVRIKAGRVVPRSGQAWHAVRQVTGPDLQVAVEDLDPFRDCQQWVAAGRLSTAEWVVWHRGLALAGRRLASAVPAYARTLAAGLRTVVPLRSARVGMQSATSRSAFGAVAITLPTNPAGIEEMLVHEFQHAKLFGLSDLYEFTDKACTLLLRVPWRDDPRPIDGVLHGTYAHLALAQLSRSRGAAGQEAWLRYRTWVCATCEALYETKALTPDGERFVAGMLIAAQAGAETQPRSTAL
jgi:uncharacterized protein